MRNMSCVGSASSIAFRWNFERFEQFPRQRIKQFFAGFIFETFHMGSSENSTSSSGRTGTTSPTSATSSSTSGGSKQVAVPWTLLKSASTGGSGSTTSSSMATFTYSGDLSKLQSAPAFDPNTDMSQPG